MAKNLSIYISKTSVRVAEVSLSENTVQILIESEFQEKREIDYKQELTRIFQDESISKDYNDVFLTWCNHNSALYPTRLFQSSNKKDLASFIHGKQIDLEELDHNRIAELDMVNIFEIPHWVKSFFIIKFPQIIIFHENTIALRSIFNSSTFKPQAFVNCFDQYFSIQIVSKNELIFSNNFIYSDPQDILYFTLYAIRNTLDKETLHSLKFQTISPKQQKQIDTIIKLIQEQNMLPNTQLNHESNQLYKKPILCV